MHSRDRERDQARQARTQLAARGSAAAPRALRTPFRAGGQHELTVPLRAAGNRAVARVLARAGDGLLPGGRVAPAVESLINRQRGSGHGVNEGVRARIESLTGDPLRDVRVHRDDVADTLARSVQARAFTTGRDLFFARGEYRPGTPAGDRLLAHELAHAAQQRGAPRSGPLTVTEPGDQFERHAERMAREAGG